MFAKPLTAGLVAGAVLLVAATVRADDTIVLKRVKGDVPAEQLSRATDSGDTLDVHFRGVRVYGGGARYYGGVYRYGYGFGYYGPRVSVGLYASPYYVAPSYYYPSYYYPSTTTITVVPSTYYPIANPAGTSSPTFRLNLDPPATPGGGETLPRPRPDVPTGSGETLPRPRPDAPAAPGETLPKPRQDRSGNQTFPYDGGPQAPVPLPRPDPNGSKPPADVPDDGKVVSLPGSAKFAYPAFGDKAGRSVFEERTVLTRDDGKKPNK